MNATQMIVEVRYAIDEATAVAWTDAELLVYLNHAQEWLQNIVVPFCGDRWVKSADIALIANQRAYAMPTDHLITKRVEWLGGDTNLAAPMAITPIIWNDKGESRFPGTVSGQPGNYFFQGANICFEPVPGVSLANAVRHWYVYRLPDLVLTPVATTSEIPAEYHDAIVLQAAIDAATKMEQTTSGLERLLERKLGTIRQSLTKRQIQEPKYVRDTWGM